MDLIKKFTFNNRVLTQVLLVLIMAIAISVIGYMFGKFIWYLSH